jgi:hypothetical protein
MALAVAVTDNEGFAPLAALSVFVASAVPVAAPDNTRQPNPAKPGPPAPT